MVISSRRYYLIFILGSLWFYSFILRCIKIESKNNVVIFFNIYIIIFFIIYKIDIFMFYLYCLFIIVECGFFYLNKKWIVL